MADIESLSFVLLIPFSICFLLVFLVCCFADKLKTFCRFPYPIPQNYSAVTSHQHRRSRGRFRTTSGHLDRDDTRILMRNQERSRNTSESSTESAPSVLTVIPENGRLLIQQGHIICPQTVLENGQLVYHPQEIIPHHILLTPSTDVTSQTYFSAPSLLRTNFQISSSGTRNLCSLPSITEKAEQKNSTHDVSPNMPSDVSSDSNEQRRNIRNLPEIITVDLISEKK